MGQRLTFDWHYTQQETINWLSGGAWNFESGVNSFKCFYYNLGNHHRCAQAIFTNCKSTEACSHRTKTPPTRITFDSCLRSFESLACSPTTPAHFDDLFMLVCSGLKHHNTCRWPYHRESRVKIPHDLQSSSSNWHKNYQLTWSDSITESRKNPSVKAFGNWAHTPCKVLCVDNCLQTAYTKLGTNKNGESYHPLL